MTKEKLFLELTKRGVSPDDALKLSLRYSKIVKRCGADDAMKDNFLVSLLLNVSIQRTTRRHLSKQLIEKLEVVKELMNITKIKTFSELRLDISVASFLREQEKTVLILWLGLDGDETRTLSGIGRELSVSSTRVRCIRDYGIEKLREKYYEKSN